MRCRYWLLLTKYSLELSNFAHSISIFPITVHRHVCWVREFVFFFIFHLAFMIYQVIYIVVETCRQAPTHNYLIIRLSYTAVHITHFIRVLHIQCVLYTSVWTPTPMNFRKWKFIFSRRREKWDRVKYKSVRSQMKFHLVTLANSRH